MSGFSPGEQSGKPLQGREATVAFGRGLLVLLDGLALFHQLFFRRRFGCRFFHSFHVLVSLFWLPLWAELVVRPTTLRSAQMIYAAWWLQWILTLLQALASKNPMPARHSQDVGVTIFCREPNPKREFLLTWLIGWGIALAGSASLALFLGASMFASWLQLGFIEQREKREAQLMYDARLRGERAVRTYSDHYGQ